MCLYQFSIKYKAVFPSLYEFFYVCESLPTMRCFHCNGTHQYHYSIYPVHCLYQVYKTIFFKEMTSFVVLCADFTRQLKFKNIFTVTKKRSKWALLFKGFLYNEGERVSWAFGCLVSYDYLLIGFLKCLITG